jgi:hypothetical protein
VRSGAERGKLEIHKRHMVAEYHIRRLQALHIYFFHLMLFEEKHYFRKEPNKPNKKHRLADGVFRGLVTFLIFVVYVFCHSFTPHTIFVHNLFKIQAKLHFTILFVKNQ